MTQEMIFSSRISGFRAPVLGSSMSAEMGLCGMTSYPWALNFLTIRLTSEKRPPRTGRPTSMKTPMSPFLKRFWASLLLIPSVPRPVTPVVSCSAQGSLKVSLITRGQPSLTGFMASTGQISARKHVPHSVHSCESIEEVSSPKLMAPTGHKGTHEPQPMHRD